MSASCGRSRSGDRFYNPPAVRRQLQLQRQQQQQQEQQLVLQKQKQQDKQERQEKQQRHHQKPSSTATSLVESESRTRTESNDCASSTRTPPPSFSCYSSSVASNLTNLDRFLEHTTPFVPALYFSKTSIRGWGNLEDESQPYFVLGDLWESFKEWSAYGAGVPLLLNGTDSVVQYYVPYLSGIQLYIDPSKPSPRIRRPGEESDGDTSRETSSDGSSDLDTDRGSNYFQGAWNQQDLTDATVHGMQRLSMRNKPFNGSSSDEGESSTGALVFEYMEYDPPYSREPLADKISTLSSGFSNLKMYRSCDLSPASWVSVAWYPIYRIPTGPTLQNLDSCFLTFHSLCTPVHGAQNEWQWQGIHGSCRTETQNGLDKPPKMLLPIFGLASYKFNVSIWDQGGGVESQKANCLLRAADEWLRLLKVSHPDYRFFVSRNYNC
ncbi:hypothetical protein Dimus_028511 [Dionaea muscipula]